MRPLDPGVFRRKLVLEEPVETGDGAGGYDTGWSEVTMVVARIEPLRADNEFGAGQTLETVTHRITLRRNAAIRSGLRFVGEGRVFDIVSVHDPDETGRYFECRAREKGL